MKEQEIIANLSHSYFDYILKDVEPFLEYFNLDLKFKTRSDLYTSRFSSGSTITSTSDGHIDVSTNIDYEIIERLFFMACLNSKDIILPFNYKCNKVVPKLKKYEWLTDLEPFKNESKQGVATKSLLFNAFHIVVKKAKTSTFDNITNRDFCVGITLNKILHKAPFFVRTLGCFQYRGDPSMTSTTKGCRRYSSPLSNNLANTVENQFYIATEFVDGINLKTFLLNKKNSFESFLNVFFQILLGLEIAQEKFNFSHYDLHTDNIILVPQNQSFEISLYGYNYTIKHEYKPVMIDFGLSSVCIRGQTLGQEKLKKNGIHNHLSPGYDIYVFLLFCLDVVKSSNLSIFKGIMDLLLFFKTKTNLSMHLLTTNHVECLKKGVNTIIPNQFVVYIVQKYSVYLNVDVEFQNNNKYLSKQPLSLKLKQILDVELEPSIKNWPQNNKKGYIKSLLNNIKIYYWYNKKINLSQNDIENLVLVDQVNLENLLYDLNLQISIETSMRSSDVLIRKKQKDKVVITTEQKNFFFIALEYYYLIFELDLCNQYPFYKKWVDDFKETFVFKNIFKQLDHVLYEERMKRAMRLM
jgi:Haspin like kinase domain